MARIPDPSPRVVRAAWVIVTILAVSVAGWLVWTVLHQADQITQARAVNDAQNDALTKANSRLVNLGAQPVPTPEPGPAGEPGIVGPAGPPGTDGKAGRDGKDGSDGARGARGLRGIPGLDGRDGAPGQDGTDGIDGQDGQDGAQGPPGPAGADGQDGADGKDGQSAFPFTFRFTVQQNPAQSTTYTVHCTADGCTVTTDQQ